MDGGNIQSREIGFPELQHTDKEKEKTQRK